MPAIVAKGNTLFIERTKKEDGELVISRGGKIVLVKARDLKAN